MANSATLDINATLDSLYTAERSSRELTAKLIAAQPSSVLEAIRSAINATNGLSSMDEQVLRLICLARLLPNIAGPEAIDALIDILGHEEEEVRMEAGTILDNIATDRFEDLQSGIERAAKRLPSGNLALQELPFVLMGVLSETDPKPLLKPFLDHKDPEAVAAAIEVISELGDPSVLPLLEKLRKDKRTVEIEDESTDETSSVGIGELAVDAINGLKEIEKAMRASSGR